MRMEVIRRIEGEKKGERNREIEKRKKKKKKGLKIEEIGIRKGRGDLGKGGLIKRVIGEKKDGEDGGGFLGNDLGGNRKYIGNGKLD